MKKTNGVVKTKNLVILALLAALLVIMAYTPLGYLNIGLLAVTFNVIPVGIGAIILGWKGGAVLGGVFGLTSFLQCFGGSAMGTTLMSINPALTVIQCFVPRILMGICVGLVSSFLITKVGKAKEISFAVCGFLSAFLNTLFYMSALVLMFGRTEYVQGLWEKFAPGRNAVVFVASFVGVNALVEALSATIITAAVMAALYRSKLVSIGVPKSANMEK